MCAWTSSRSAVAAAAAAAAAALIFRVQTTLVSFPSLRPPPVHSLESNREPVFQIFNHSTRTKRMSCSTGQLLVLDVARGVRLKWLEQLLAEIEDLGSNPALSE